MDEQFIQLAFEIAKQSPTIFLLGLGVWEFRKREFSAIDKLDKAQKLHIKAMKDLNVEVRAHEKEHYEAIDKLTDALDKFKK